MRGGLDDALDKLARRDELRRRATGEAPGTTPAAVTELVEAVAAVVARHPELGVSVGVEGAGDPLLLHFYLAEGQVQVNAENAAALAPEPSGPRHADSDLDADEPADRPYSAVPHSAVPHSSVPHSAVPHSAVPYSAAPAPSADQMGGDTRRLSHDDQDRFGPASFGYNSPPPAEPAHYADADTAERRYADSETTRLSYADSDTTRRYGNSDPTQPRYDDSESTQPRYGSSDTQPRYGDPDTTQPRYGDSDTAERRYGGSDAQAQARAGDSGYPRSDPGESSRDLGARLRDLGMATSGQPPAYPPHPFAATPPPPVPPQSSAETMPPQPRPAVPPQDDSAGPTRRIRPDHHRPPAEPSAAERGASARGPVPEQRGMPAPLPHPIPLQVERPEETEIAARRLAALLRDDPSLLDQPRS
ncbi:hypothetical protein [Actinoplanes sp. M2I2]|uniref:hypothetical protein n=1 Tax=Actinoplanes sp. M2I2 TaxID=1734444 RepID=UPI00201FEDF5|nr:hypothetical protein [Actinoplanes sp. M2I2]